MQTRIVHVLYNVINREFTHLYAHVLRRITNGCEEYPDMPVLTKQIY